jgi:glucose-1-phosphate thymidylyltransferase
MKAILLAAGYATRLYPLTENRPKALLAVAGRTILERTLEKLAIIPEIDQIFIVSNHRFFGQFQQWAAGYKSPVELLLLDDGSTTNENRRGAIADIQFAIQAGAIQDDILVLASDNLFPFEFTGLADALRQTPHDLITIYQLDDPARLRRTGVVTIDTAFRVTGFQEKPAEPASHWAAPPIYFYRKSTLPLFQKYLMEANNSDAPGHFIPWLIQRKEVHAVLLPGPAYDIGNLESYQKAQEIFWE